MEQHFVDPQSVFHMEQTRCGSPKITKLLLPCRTAYRKLSEALSGAFGSPFGSFRKPFQELVGSLSEALRKSLGTCSEAFRKPFGRSLEPFGNLSTCLLYALGTCRKPLRTHFRHPFTTMSVPIRRIIGSPSLDLL